MRKRYGFKPAGILEKRLHGARISLALRFRTPQAGVMQFKDLNADKSAFQRTYANQARAR